MNGLHYAWAYDFGHAIGYYIVWPLLILACLVICAYVGYRLILNILGKNGGA